MPDKLYKIKRFPLTNGWNEIVTPVACNSIGLKMADGGAIKISTDTSDPDDWDMLPAGSQEGLMGPMHTRTVRPRFDKGYVCFYLDPEGAGRIAVLRFLL